MTTYTLKCPKFKVSQDAHQLTIVAEFGNSLYTSQFPDTHKILTKLMPEVLATKCFNPDNLAFKDEVRDTELGHLFEHILLANLCELGCKNKDNQIQFRGVTEWDWKKDHQGTFHITIDSGLKNLHKLEIALERTSKLVNKIIN